MTEDPNNRPEDRKPGPPVMMIPKSVFYIVGALLIGSFLMTLFVRNPYMQSVHEGGTFYENVTDNSLMMWVAFFIGIPVSFWAYKRWVLPLFEKK